MQSNRMAEKSARPAMLELRAINQGASSWEEQ
jgi:hypothetical protein